MKFSDTHFKRKSNLEPIFYSDSDRGDKWPDLDSVIIKMAKKTVPDLNNLQFLLYQYLWIKFVGYTI